jgi:hypothetical protein
LRLLRSRQGRLCPRMCPAAVQCRVHTPPMTASYVRRTGLKSPISGARSVPESRHAAYPPDRFFLSDSGHGVSPWPTPPAGALRALSHSAGQPRRFPTLQ